MGHIRPTRPLSVNYCLSITHCYQLIFITSILVVSIKIVRSEEACYMSQLIEQEGHTVVDGTYTQFVLKDYNPNSKSMMV